MIRYYQSLVMADRAAAYDAIQAAIAAEFCGVNSAPRVTILHEHFAKLERPAPAPFDPEAERAQAREAMQAKLEAETNERTARPFRFEDLQGKPEPERWGPLYPKTASTAVEKWRAWPGPRVDGGRKARPWPGGRGMDSRAQ